MGSSKRTRASSNKSRDRQKTAKLNPTDSSPQDAIEPPHALLEPRAVIDCEIVTTLSVKDPVLENVSSSLTKVEFLDFDAGKLMEYYHDYGVDCLVSNNFLI